MIDETKIKKNVPPESERGVLLVLDLEERVQHHGAAAVGGGCVYWVKGGGMSVVSCVCGGGWKDEQARLTTTLSPRVRNKYIHIEPKHNQTHHPNTTHNIHTDSPTLGRTRRGRRGRWRGTASASAPGPTGTP